MSRYQIMRFMAGRFLSALGDQFLLFAAPLIVYQATGSVAKSGLAFLIEWTPRILFLPVAGFFADRFNHRHLYLVADFSRVIVCIVAYFFLQSEILDPFVTVSLMMGCLAVFNTLAKFGPRRPTKSVPFRPVISVRWRPGKSDQSARPAA